MNQCGITSAGKPEAQHHAQAFKDHLEGQFGLARASLHKDDRNFLEALAGTMEDVVNLVERGEAVGFHVCEIDRFQRCARETLKASGEIVEGNTEEKASDDAGSATDDLPVEGPTFGPAASGIA